MITATKTAATGSFAGIRRFSRKGVRTGRTGGVRPPVMALTIEKDWQRRPPLEELAAAATATPEGGAGTVYHKIPPSFNVLCSNYEKGRD